MRSGAASLASGFSGPRCRRSMQSRRNLPPATARVPETELRWACRNVWPVGIGQLWHGPNSDHGATHHVDHDPNNDPGVIHRCQMLHRRTPKAPLSLRSAPLPKEFSYRPPEQNRVALMQRLREIRSSAPGYKLPGGDRPGKAGLARRDNGAVQFQREEKCSVQGCTGVASMTKATASAGTGQALCIAVVAQGGSGVDTGTF